MPLNCGIPTLLECPTLEQSLTLCSELGLDFIELNMNLPEYQLANLNMHTVNKLLANSGKYITIHLDENLNVCDFNPAVADAYLNTVIQTIEFAKNVNAPIINMHMADGVYFTLPDKKVYLFEQYTDRYLSALHRFRDSCDKAIGENDITVCIENSGKYHGFQQKGIDLLLESSNFALTYDIGHSFIGNGADEQFILSRANKLKHMHIHDATTQSHHLSLGDGEIDIYSKLTLAQKYGCRCVLETKTVEGLRKSVAWINSNWRKSIDVPQTSISVPLQFITNDCSNDDKVNLFLSLFRGRDDVYARRWESKDGKKSGYSPVCRNEWAARMCGKPKVKCADCENREFVSFDKQMAARHLAGREVAGIYPMLPDETCLFLAIDFDDENWQGDVSAIRSVCERNEIPVAVERSRSGNGAHVWLFFSEPVSASLARKLGSAILTVAMDERHELKFKSYDRLFPNQDTMPKGGFGNLIALPLQRAARDKGNSVFIDEQFTSYPDQWAFLNGVKRLTVNEVEHHIAALCKYGELGNLYRSDEEESNDTPWRKRTLETNLDHVDFPSELRIIEANVLYIEKHGISQRALNKLKRIAAFKNPEFYKAQAMRFPTWDKPRIISISDETEKYLCLPRGCRDEVLQMLENLNVPINRQDERNAGRTIDVSFNGTLRDEQTTALDKLLAHDNGILSATTAFGKTVVSAALIASRKVNTLVLVNRQPLLDQWKTRLTEFLTINEELPEQEKKGGKKKERSIVGQLGGGKNDLNGIIDIAIIQSLVSGDGVKDIVKNYGMVIVDECHHVSAVSFERVLKEVNAKYVYGLTATPKRQDGHQPIIYMHCGQIRYNDNAKLQALRRPFEHFVIPRFTTFRVPVEKDDNSPLPIQELYAEICQSESRNALIVSDVLEAVAQGRNSLILTERKSHVDLLENALKEKLPDIITFVGGRSKKERKILLDVVYNKPPEKPLVIIATGKYVGEGFDVPRLDTLFLAMPIVWQGTLAQYAGRLHRLYDDKREVRVYDYVDIHVPVLDRMYAKRVKGYSAIGYKTKSDAAIPETGNIIFDGISFLPIFQSDLLSAKREVLIVSPFVAKRGAPKMLQTLSGMVSSGIKVTVVTRPADKYKVNDQARVNQVINTLRVHGIAVAECAKTHQKFAVIDERTTWYGSVNLLGFAGVEESIMRLESKSISRELLKTVSDFL